MKIGIITHPLINNYGGILQNYALQQVLKDMGHEVLTVDRIPNTPLKIKFLSLCKRSFLKLRGKKVKLRAWQKKSESKIVNGNTRSFVRKYIDTTYKITKKTEILKLHRKYNFDAYIVGSDQVWRRNETRGNDLEFLGFIENENSIRKISYAASFGSNEWEYKEDETKRFANLAQKFDAVSVREDEGIQLCAKYLNIEAKHHIDPTLLLNKEKYISLVESSDVSKSVGSLFCYILDRSTQKTTIIERISKKKDLISFEVLPEQDFRMILNNGFDIYKCVFPPIEQWLRAFIDAEFVVTDSFHGTVFAIIFNKPFIAIVNKRRGASRFYSLLNMFDLKSRLIDLEDDLVNLDGIISQKIDFQKVQQKIDFQKEIAYNYLKTSLLS